MNGQELIDLIKSGIRSEMSIFGNTIGSMSDLEALHMLGSGCTSGMIKTRVEDRIGFVIQSSTIRKMLDRLAKDGLLVKKSHPGSWSTYWPSGFANELRSDAA